MPFGQAGLDTAIAALRGPLLTLQEEVAGVKGHVDQEITLLTSKMDQRSARREQKVEREEELVLF